MFFGGKKEKAKARSENNQSTEIQGETNSQNDYDDEQQTKSKIRELEQKLEKAKQQVSQEKAGKRKIFHSLVKLANELKRTKQESGPLLQAQEYANQPWYEGGLWRNQVQVLPGVGQEAGDTRFRGAEAVSLSDLFLDMVIVIAFTRVGEAISNNQSIDFATALYFAVFWQIWSKEASYSSRFDTSDLSAKMETLLTCFAVLFGSLSASFPINSEGATRIMMTAGFCAVLNCLLHLRVALILPAVYPPDGKSLNERRESFVHNTRQDVRNYAIFNAVMTILEATNWAIGSFVIPDNWSYRWVIFLLGVVLAFRVPRAFLANDFHAACSKRGVLFILLLGFLMQSIVVVASEFFEYDTPSRTQYCFIGACCLILFCIKLLYVEDADTLAEDHALLVNRTAAFLFNVGHFCLLLSTTVMGSGLNLVTHEYLAATAALPSQAKNLVVGGFSAVVLSTFFIKSMHVKRVPADNSRHRRLFVAAYVTQAIVTLAVVAVTAAMCLGGGGYLKTMEENDTELLFVLATLAVFLVALSWLDQGVELSLYETSLDSQEFRVEPFGIWSCCLDQEVTDEELLSGIAAEDQSLSRRFSALSPLLGGSSAAFLKAELKDTEGYGSMQGGMGEV